MSSEDQGTTADGIHPEFRAIEELVGLIKDGRAQEVLETYYFCKQSCDYVYGILVDIANADSGISDEIVNFARNLLDDWSK